MSAVLVVLYLAFNLVFVPLNFADQPFDGVDNVLRNVVGVSEPVSRLVVSELYDAFPLEAPQ